MTPTIKLNADNYPIKSVTVLSSPINTLQSGQSKIQISHLSSSIDTESARVSGLGDAQLSDVVCSVGRGLGEVDAQSTSEAIRKLQVKRNARSNDRDAFENLLTRSQTLRSQHVEMEEEILQLTRQIDVLLSAEQNKQGLSDGEVTVVIAAKQATEIELKLT